MDAKYTDISISNSPDSETMRNVFVLFIKYWAYDIVAKQQSQTKTEPVRKNFSIWVSAITL